MTKTELAAELLAIANEVCGGHARTVYVPHIKQDRVHGCKAELLSSGRLCIDIDTDKCYSTRKEDLAMLQIVYRAFIAAVEKRFGDAGRPVSGVRLTCAKKPGSTGFWHMGRFCETSFYRFIEIKDAE